MKTRHEILMESPEYRRLYAIEGLVTDAAELVAQLMEEQGVTKAELACRLGKSRAWITQLLSGSANMTIRTFAELVYELGAEVKLSAQLRKESREREPASRERTVVYEAPEIGIGQRRQPRFRLSAGERSPIPDNHERPMGPLEYAA